MTPPRIPALVLVLVLGVASARAGAEAVLEGIRERISREDPEGATRMARGLLEARPEALRLAADAYAEAESWERPAELQRQRGWLPSALESLERAVEARVALLGPEDPPTAGPLGQMAMIQLGLGNPARAEGLFARGLEVLLGVDHPSCRRYWDEAQKFWPLPAEDEEP